MLPSEVRAQVPGKEGVVIGQNRIVCIECQRGTARPPGVQGEGAGHCLPDSMSNNVCLEEERIE